MGVRLNRTTRKGERLTWVSLPAAQKAADQRQSAAVRAPPQAGAARAGRRGNNARREFQRLIVSALMTASGIGLLAEPVAATLTNKPLSQTIALCMFTGTLWCLTQAAVRFNRRGWLRQQMIAWTVVSTILGLYACNNGIFGTVVDPGLFSFGVATMMALDGSRMSLLCGLIYGWTMILVCSIWFPLFYYGTGTFSVPMHAAFNLLWWTMPVVLGNVMGRRVQSILSALHESRLALETAQQREREAAQLSEQLKDRAAAERIATISTIAAGFDRSMQAGMQALLELSSTLEQAAVSAEQTALRAREDGDVVASLASSSSGESIAVAAATGKLSNTIGDVRLQITSATRATEAVMQKTAHSDEALAALTNSAARVDTMLAMIKQIAGRTNLLAINAAIEAAHTGQAGLGFAVVAVEVKRLASQTTSVASEIGSLVLAMRHAVAEMTNAMQSVKDSIISLSGITGLIAQAMDEQTAATDQIAGRVYVVAENMAATSERAGQLLGRIQQTSEANRNMMTGVAAVRQGSRSLQNRAGEFMSQLRAG